MAPDRPGDSLWHTWRPGTRITVSDILRCLAEGMNSEDILSDFAETTQRDIRACLAHARDREHRLG